MAMFSDEQGLSGSDRPLDVAINAGYTTRFVIKAVTNNTAPQNATLEREQTSPKVSDVIAKLNAQDLNNNNARASAKTKRSAVNAGSTRTKEQRHFVPEHLSEVRQSRKSSRRRRGDKPQPFMRSKSEGRVKTAVIPDLLEAQPRRRREDVAMDRKGSRRQQAAAGQLDGAEFQKPAARLIESRRRRKRDRSLDDKAASSSSAALDSSRRGGSLRSVPRSKSVSNIFQKSFSLRKKQHPMTPAPRTELSTDDTPPGVLRIFGPAISPGTQYKSVLASSNSLADELVKEALDRYAISRQYCRHFVLCDVIGQFVAASYAGDGDDRLPLSEGVWQEECIRIIGDNERPLILQSFWKPSEGFSRRFELRNRGEFVSVEQYEAKQPSAVDGSKPVRDDDVSSTRRTQDENHNHVDSDTSSSRTSKRHKRGSHRRVKTATPEMDSSLSSASDLAQIQANMRHLVENNVTSEYESSHQSSSYRKLTTTTTTSNSGARFDCSVTTQSWSNSLGASVTGGGDSNTFSRMNGDTPFIINLKGFQPERDNLVHFLSNHSTVVGCDMMKLGVDDICLPASDVLSQHCRVARPDGDDDDGRCTVEPFQGALVKVNNRPILQRSPLLPGDVLSLGNHYVFMFRHPKVERHYDQNNFALIRLLNSGSLGAAAKYYHPGDVIPSTPVPHAVAAIPTQQSEPTQVVEWRKQRLEKYNDDIKRLKMSYKQKQEDELLKRILTVTDSSASVYKLAPSFLLAACVEYAATHFEQVHVRELLLKIANSTKTLVLVRDL